MDMVMIALCGSVLAVSVTVSHFVQQYKKNQDLTQKVQKLTDALRQQSEAYALEDADEKLARHFAAILKKVFGSDIDGVFIQHQSMESKRLFVNDLTRQLVIPLGIRLDCIDYFDPGKKKNGAVICKDGTFIIELNEGLMLADPEKFVRVLVHELRHCIQYQSLTENRWGFSENRIAQWLYGVKNYIDGEDEFYREAYMLQVIERDPCVFADYVFSLYQNGNL